MKSTWQAIARIALCSAWFGACQSSDDSVLTESKGGAGSPISSDNDGTQGATPGAGGTTGGSANGTASGGSSGIGTGATTGGGGTVNAEGATSSVPVEDAGMVPVIDEIANPFVTPSHDPFSTFGADVDTASYDMFRQYVTGSGLPPASSVRVEDFVNFFAYDYPAPAADAEHPFTIDLAAGPHPFGRSTELLRIGIQAKLPPAQEKKPANLVFLVDVSGSMSDADKLPLVKVLLKKTLTVLEPTDTISIVTYAGSTALALEPTPVAQRVAIEGVINGLGAGGSTNGAGGIQLAYEQAADAKIEGGINHVLLCTDGDFNVGISEPKALATFISEKRDTGITMTALGFGRARSGDALMEALSNHGDGIYGVVYDEDQAIQYVNERMLSTLVRIAKDMKLQVEFNPELVAAYRLIGYENRAIDDDDFRNDLVDSGDIGAGHRVTALYEVVRTGQTIPMPAGAPALEDGPPVEGAREIATEELVRVKIRYKPITATTQDSALEVSRALLPADVLAKADDASQDFAWAAALATLAEILRNSPFASESELEQVSSIISAQAARDVDRSELQGLMPTVRRLIQER